MEELAGISESHCEILYHTTRYVLSIISLKVSKEHGDGNGVSLEDLDECDRLSKVVETIGQWLLKNVGYVKFGGMQLKKFDEEVRVSIHIIVNSLNEINISFCPMQVWRVLYRDSIYQHETIKEHWIKAINHLLVKRAKTV